MEFEPPLLRLEIESAAGFYVRSLAHDLGQSLGCGAHLAELRRTRAGPFNESDAVSVSEVENAVASDRLAERLRSLDVPLLDQPAVILAEQHSRDIAQGKPLTLAISGAPPSERLCRAYSGLGELIGVLELDSDGTARPVRVFPEGHRGPNIEHE
jgi:tRNA pseudouridine55 synthase